MDLNNIIGQIVMNLEPRVIIYTHLHWSVSHILTCVSHTHKHMYVHI